MTRPFTRVSIAALVLAITALVLAIAATTVESVAHHPGSHAVRQPDGKVRLDVAITTADACTSVEGVALGAPATLKAPQGAEPVTVRLKRPEGAVCAQVVSALREEAVLAVPAAARLLHLFVLGSNGGLSATERVPIR